MAVRLGKGKWILFFNCWFGTSTDLTFAATKENVTECAAMFRNYANTEYEYPVDYVASLEECIQLVQENCRWANIAKVDDRVFANQWAWCWCQIGNDMTPNKSSVYSSCWFGENPYTLGTFDTQSIFEYFKTESFSMINLTDFCGSHDDCPADYPFCYNGGLCGPCSECRHCQDGIDRTCGSCGDGYPTRESVDCANTTERTTGNATAISGMINGEWCDAVVMVNNYYSCEQPLTLWNSPCANYGKWNEAYCSSSIFWNKTSDEGACAYCADATKHPSANPTTGPTAEPTDPSADPTANPTTEPTSDPTNGFVVVSTVPDDPTITYLFAMILIALLCITIVIGLYISKMRKRQTKFRREMSVKLTEMSHIQKVDSFETRQGAIACIAIGEYDGSEYSDLSVERDVENLRKFSNFMGYDFIERPNKLHWTEEEVKSFLMNDIGNNLFRQSGKPKYDVLVVCVSAHGLRDRVVTSDGQLMDRAAIHRMISLHFPKIRDIPRIFVFDACAGPQKYIDKRSGLNQKDHASVAKVTMSDELNVVKVVGKNTDVEDIKVEEAWTSETKNPDYKLAVINSANIGFQAKMGRDEIGSLLIYLFTRKLKRNIENHENRVLADIMDDIQEELHDAGEQQIQSIFNNGTEHLILKINSSGDMPEVYADQ